MAQETSNVKKAMQEELIRGHDIANRLLEILIHKSSTQLHEEGLILPLAQDLVCKVLISFTNTLLLLNNNGDAFHEEIVPLSVNCTKSGHMDGAYKSTFNTKQQRRGCYRRKLLNTSTWERDSSILIEDGYAWRKYGQKMTTTSKYLKSYYRCTHKFDQACPAIKQVQRIQKDPPLYRTTYFGYHTCKRTLIPDTILEPDSSFGSSVLLSFNNSLPIKQEYPFSSPLLASAKQEPMEVIHDNHIAQNQISSSEYLLLCDYEHDFNHSRHFNMLSSTESVQFDYVYGCSLDFIS